MKYERLRRILWRLEAETAHKYALRTIAAGMVRGRIVEDARLVCSAFGQKISNPLGLAAGFDKNAVAVRRWRSFGFGFAEIGTVTPNPQEGNPRPRMFRLPEDEAIINRLGFNSRGVEAVTKKLKKCERDYPIGVNIGKNKDTPQDMAVQDYVDAFSGLAPLADYAVVNVSSPNTPGLRDLQEAAVLKEIVQALKEVDADTPLYIKVSPDQSDHGISDIVRVALAEKVQGIIATNTTVTRGELKSRLSGEKGGLSGKPLKQKAERVCSLIRQEAGDGLEIIGVGGIFTGDDLYDRLRAGANVCETYTAFVYRGPDTAALILEEMLERMEREGISSVEDISSS